MNLRLPYSPRVFPGEFCQIINICLPHSLRLYNRHVCMHNTRHPTVIIHHLPCLLILFTWHIRLKPRDIDQLVCIILDHRSIILRCNRHSVIIAVIRTLYEDDVRMPLLDIVSLIILYIQVFRVRCTLIIHFFLSPKGISAEIRNRKHSDIHIFLFLLVSPYTVKRFPI